MVSRGKKGSRGTLPYARINRKNGKVSLVRPHSVKVKPATVKGSNKELFYSLPYEQRTVSVYNRKGIKQGRGEVSNGKVVVFPRKR